MIYHINPSTSTHITTTSISNTHRTAISNFKQKEEYNIPSYLAGLIEGDGSIVVPGENIKSYNPYFEIVFHIKDRIIAEFIQLKIGGSGSLTISENYCILKIKSKSSVLKVIHLINGNLRTPKIEALHRMINWFNTKYNYNIKPLDLDRSPIYTNSWLSGFIDADGSFYLNWSYYKKDKVTSLQYYMRISQRQEYHRDSLSYFNIMSEISSFLSVPLRKRVRDRKSYIEKSYEVRTGSYLSNYIMLNYLLKYPLFSYKYSAIPIFIELLQLSKNRNYKLDSGLYRLKILKERLQYNVQDSENINRESVTHLSHILKYFYF